MRLDGVPDMASGWMEGPPRRKRRGFHRGKKNAGEIIKASFREAAKRQLPLQEPSIPAGKGASHVSENRESKSYSRVGGSL